MKWTGGPEAGNSTFFYNGKNVGSGETGLNALLGHLADLNVGAMVTFDYPKEALEYYEQKYQDFDGLPIISNDSSPWRRLSIQKGLMGTSDSTQ